MKQKCLEIVNSYQKIASMDSTIP